MKRIIIICFCFCVTSVFAQNYNKAQETLRLQVSDYLSRQGYSPELQSDGLKFKTEGNNYYVEIDKNEKAPMYLRLCRYIKYDKKITRNKVMKNINECNGKYAAKVLCQDNSVVVSAELFVTKSSEFTDAFDTLLDLVQSACLVVEE